MTKTPETNTHIPNLSEVQKTYEALIAPETDAGKKLEFDSTRMFKTEFARQSYLVRLTGENLAAAIIWLKKPENSWVSNCQNMLSLLTEKQGTLADIQARTRAELSGHTLVIDATVKGLEYKPHTPPNITITQWKDRKTYPVFVYEYKNDKSEEVANIEIRDAGQATRVVWVPKKRIDDVLKYYQNWNIEHTFLFSGAVKWEEIKDKMDTSSQASVVNHNPGSTPVLLGTKDPLNNPQKPVLQSSSNTPVRPQEIISTEQYNSIKWALRIESQTTATVRKHAGAIVDLLKQSPNLSEVKPALVVLADSNKAVTDFQATLSGRVQDGVIGCGDIVALLTLAGVANKDIPQIIQDKVGKEKKIIITTSATVAVTPKITTAPTTTLSGPSTPVTKTEAHPVAATQNPVAPTLSENTTKRASEVLASVQQLPGLKWITKLADLGFIVTDAEFTRPEWIVWQNPGKTGDFSVKLQDGYEVKAGKIEKKNATATLSENNTKRASEVLASVKKIPGLEWITNLADLGFMVTNAEFTRPEWIVWQNPGKTGDFSVKLQDGYEVKAGKIEKKVPAVSPITDIEIKAASAALTIVKELNPLQVPVSTPDNFYYGKDLLHIDYALLKQPEGDFFLYDKIVDGARNVYRLDDQKNLIGMISIKSSGENLKAVGRVMNRVPYNVPMPTVLAPE